MTQGNKDDIVQSETKDLSAQEEGKQSTGYRTTVNNRKGDSMKTFHKTVTGVILAICMVYLLLPQGNVLAIEQSIRDNATEVSLDQAVTGTTTNGNEVWYKFNTSAENRSYTITFNTTDNASCDVYVGIYDDMNAELRREQTDASSKSFTVKPPLSSICYIKVNPRWNNQEIGYAFKLTSRADEPDTKETAEELDIRQVKMADLCSKDDVDFYKFTTGNESLRYEIKAAVSDSSNASIDVEKNRLMVRERYWQLI